MERGLRKGAEREAQRAELVKRVEQYLKKAGGGEVSQVRLSVGPATYSEAQVRSVLNGLVKAGKARFTTTQGWKSGWTEYDKKTFGPVTEATDPKKKGTVWVDGIRSFTTYWRVAEAA